MTACSIMPLHAQIEVARLLFARDGHTSRQWDELGHELQDYWLALAYVWISTHDWAAVQTRVRAFTLVDAKDSS